MARKNPDLAEMDAGANFLTDFYRKLRDAVEKRGGKFADIHQLVKKGGESTFDKLAELIVGKVKNAADSLFKLWKTLQFGTGLKTADDFRRTLKTADCRISDWANDILGRARFTNVTGELDLAVVSVAELGFPNGATRKEIYQKAQELGLELCPPEVGPQLRLQYQNQPMGEWLLIGMKPIAGSDGYLKVFHVVRYDDLWLFSFYDDSDSVWYGYSRWVFLRRK